EAWRIAHGGGAATADSACRSASPHPLHLVGLAGPAPEDRRAEVCQPPPMRAGVPRGLVAAQRPRARITLGRAPEERRRDQRIDAAMRAAMARRLVAADAAGGMTGRAARHRLTAAAHRRPVRGRGARCISW